MLLKDDPGGCATEQEAGFSTLYRVDAIEGTSTIAAAAALSMSFQYPLSGRCY